MAASDKDTIYVDIDDEITGIIDKLRGSSGKVVALVLPKRAAVFQSIVNMKLLKRAADSSKKNLVLITSEAGLLPLAGAAGVHVAKTLTSKPEIPLGPGLVDDVDDEEVTEELEGSDEPVDATQPIGKLAGAKAAGDEVETLVLDDEDVPPEADDTPAESKSFTPPRKKSSKLKVPNFERFRLLLVAGVLGLILLIVGLIFAGSVLPKATISIKTDATNVDTNANLNLSTTATTLKTADNTVPAKLASLPKTYTQQVPTTGQKNNGNKASGSITITNCSGADANLPAGTGFSSNGNTYISQTSVTVPDSNYKINGDCKKDGHFNVDVLAQSGGAAYNLPSGSSFAVASGGGKLTATGNTIAGGTDSIVQTVNQNDINGAKSKITANETEIRQTLKDQLLKDGFYAIDATYSAGTPTVTSSANVGDVANNVTVTQNVAYTMFGVKQADLKTVIQNSIKDQIDTSKQSVLDDGLSKAVFNVDNMSATGGQVAMSTKATVGPDLHVDKIRQEAAGKKPGAIKSQLETNPDVTSVDVKLSPFWVSAVPKKTSRITVDIAKPTTSTKASNSNGGTH